LSDKAIISISIDPEIKEKAHSLGLNISRVSENALRIIIERILDTNYGKQLTSEPIKQKNSKEVF